MRRALAALLALATAAGCGSPAALVAKAPEYAPRDQAKARSFKNQDEPLIIEWPAAERTKLEALARRGAVAVHYQGDTMAVLGHCRVPGAYGYVSTTPQRERVTIRDEDDLHAALPLGAARLEAALKKAGQLQVSLTIVGTFQAERDAIGRDELEGDCASATHVVTALAVGAFEFFAGGDASLGADASVGSGPATQEVAGAHSTAKREILNQGGDQAVCAKATAEDTAPPYGCGALLRVEVVRLVAPKKTEPADASPAAEPEPPKAEPTPRETPRAETSAPPFFTSYEPLPSPPGTTTGPPPSDPTAAIVIGSLITVGLGIGVGWIIYDRTKEEKPGPTGGFGSGTSAFGRPLFSW
ncbi:hypothetical protein [Polyangium sorediatum]|uniref:Lipoprotein n=1 Tax=Polyangium sorediatum TaxID=889274 RepID=A0ABT6P8L3_9BACT|nr:hypothetical protein [Polyangium sorediatum]MDI1436505.1 hypothetical protein [Polyangium sorediatum]